MCRVVLLDELLLALLLQPFDVAENVVAEELLAEVGLAAQDQALELLLVRVLVVEEGEPGSFEMVDEMLTDLG